MRQEVLHDPLRDSRTPLILEVLRASLQVPQGRSPPSPEGPGRRLLLGRGPLLQGKGRALYPCAGERGRRARLFLFGKVEASGNRSAFLDRGGGKPAALEAERLAAERKCGVPRDVEMLTLSTTLLQGKRLRVGVLERGHPPEGTKPENAGRAIGGDPRKATLDGLYRYSARLHRWQGRTR